MPTLPSLKKVQLAYLGRIYYLTYFTTLHRFFGFRLSSWIRFLSVVLAFTAWVRQWPMPLLLAAILLAVWINLTYWRARRAGFNKFLPDEAAVAIPSTEELVPLPPNQHIQMQATGVFSVNDKEDFLLLRPAEYWQVPLGDHIVMVQQQPHQFRYQFFNATSLQEVRAGWLIFGNRPHLALAVTFLLAWGPEFNELTQVYMTHHNSSSSRPREKRTIYFTFDDADNRRAVWHNLVYDARRARSSA